jgi:NAD(P)-dependent dehydrogenase (short-subunit alcohol dehydrogenase family)
VASNAELFDLTGRVALVSGGASGGFGTQIVAALSEAGARVALTSRTLQRAEELVAMQPERELLPLSMELADESSIVAAVAATVARFGRLDILVNSATTIALDPLEEIALDQFNRILATNVGGTMALSRAAAPWLRQGGHGAIINLSSIYGQLSPDQRIYGNSGLNSPLVYGVSKAAIEQMTRYLATSWAPAIRVNAIAPGGLYNHQPQPFVDAYVARTPLGRMAGSDDLKGAALYLASDASRWVTGQSLLVDGGWSVW